MRKKKLFLKCDPKVEEAIKKHKETSKILKNEIDKLSRQLRKERVIDV